MSTRVTPRLFVPWKESEIFYCRDPDLALGRTKIGGLY